MAGQDEPREGGRWAEITLELLAALILCIGGVATLLFLLGCMWHAVTWAWNWN